MSSNSTLPLAAMAQSNQGLGCGERGDCTLRESIEEALQHHRTALARLEAGIQAIPDHLLTMKVKELREMGLVWDAWAVVHRV